ncbi:patched domain-containing protein 3-like [Centruroides sculpturatus]|uniref:patched domain-containing protein 3-like n=1 Tax=Centruroides sculpturatus TaxID=218467 RepID=UPI000C6D0AAA|nr:patched domain-containing protein 3-like [Centruroides sculpturatus]XP_023229008.1 patched domain-containing protein 3-like [Centruroides sculpturatus]
MFIGIAYRYLSKLFHKHGIHVSKHTSWYLIVPVFMTLLSATGFQKFSHDLDEESIVPAGGIIDRYKSHLMQLFPIDLASNFDPARLLHVIHYGTVIAEATDGGSILRDFVFREIVTLDREIQKFFVEKDEGWNYKDICARNNGKCYENKILRINNELEALKNGTFRLKYPIGDTSRNYDVLTLGGVELNEEGCVISAEAVKLFYFLDDSNKWAEEKAIMWENRFVDFLNKVNFSHIKISKDVSLSVNESKKQLFLATLKYIPSSAFLMVTFTVISCLWPDFLRSKPWTGIMSSIATGMSVISGFGLLQYARLKVSPMEMMIPFLILGIGMDDTFVMLSAWMKTDPKKSVEERMAETFTESGVSITITSLTNVASFLVGIFIATIPLYKKLCVFMATCMIFDYIYQITFVAATLVLCGRAEEQHLHSLVFTKLPENTNCFQRILCFVHSENAKNEEVQKNILAFTKLVKNFKALMKTKMTTIIVILLYFTYLGISIWGLTKYSYDQELDMNLILDTYRYNYYKINEKYYNQYKFRLQLFITQELDYSNRTIQQNVENMLHTLESDPLIAASLTESWLRSYLKFFDDNRINLFLTGYNVTNSEDFVFVLHKLFFRIPEAKRFRQDIVFDSSSTRIISTRFFLQTNVTNNGSHFYNQFKHFQEKMNAFPFTIVLYHPLFYYFDINDAIPTTTIQTLGIVSFTVSVISAALLPNVICIVCVLFSIISVGAGVIGFMFIFNLGLNLTSLSILIIVIGYSVDYAAHVSCAYISAKESSPDKRLENAISLTAIPIIQGSVTTILAIVTALNVSEKETLLAIKVIILACVIAGIHGLTFVPIIISVIDRIFQKCLYLIFKWKSSDDFSLNQTENIQSIHRNG